MAINYRDPRFQEALLAAGSRPRATQGQINRVTSDFVTQQQGVLNRFSALATNKRRFDANLRLAQDKLAFEKKVHKQSLKDARDASRLGIISGLGTSLVAGLIGMDRRRKTERAAGEQRAFNEKMYKSQQEQNKYMRGIWSNITGRTS